MQQLLDSTVSPNNDSSEVNGYNSPVLDAFPDGSDVRLSPVGLVNDESGLGDITDASRVFPEQLNVDQLLQSVGLTDLLQVPSSTETECVLPSVISQHPVLLDSTHDTASQQSYCQLTYVIYCNLLITSVSVVTRVVVTRGSN